MQLDFFGEKDVFLPLSHLIQSLFATVIFLNECPDDAPNSSPRDHVSCLF